MSSATNCFSKHVSVFDNGYVLMVIKEFIKEVEKRAEEKMIKTNKLEGAHYAAMKEIFEEMKTND